MSPSGDPLVKRALVVQKGDKAQRDLERKALAAAFKQSFESGDTDGAALAHKGLCAILQQQLYDDRDGSSSGSVIPPSVWKTENKVNLDHKVSEPAEFEKAKAKSKPNSLAAKVAAKLDAAAKIAARAGSVAKAAARLEPRPAKAETPEPVSQPVVSRAEAEQPAVKSEAVKPEQPAVKAEIVEPEQPAVKAETVEPEQPAEQTEKVEAAKQTRPAKKAQVAEEAAAQATEDAEAQTDVVDTGSRLVQILDPREVEEAFALIDMAPASEVPTSNYTVDAAGKSLHARSAQMLMEVPRSLGGLPVGGEITAALERLTAAMPISTGPPASPPPAQAPPEETASPESEKIEPPPVADVIAQPMLEAPTFEAPTPQFEESPPPVEEPPPPQSQESPAPESQESPLPQLEEEPPPQAVLDQQFAPPDDLGAGPISYLDFGEDQPQPVAHSADVEEELKATPEVIAQMFAQAEAEANRNKGLSAPPPPSMTPSQLIKTQSFYQILGVNKLSSYDQIHKKFVRVARRMLRARMASTYAPADAREFREVLRAICVAHDVLRDPVTRTDYDLRQLGMRQENVEAPAESAAPRTRLMIGELLEIANILDRTELQIALDMHKAEPGTMFGTFLVKAGFLDPEELDSALLGQRLISAGKITVAQFQSAMFRMRDHSAPFFDTLVVEGWLTPADMLSETGGLWNKGQNAPAQPDKAQEPNAPQESTEKSEKSPSDSDTNGHDSDDHSSVIAAAKRAEQELLKAIESDEPQE